MKNRIRILQWHDAEFACPVCVFPASVRQEPPEPRVIPRINRNERPVRPLTRGMSVARSGIY
jgi:hypothetical protein